MNAMHSGESFRSRKICLLVLGSLALSIGAHADEPRKPQPTNPAWQEECGSCHIAYPPRFLPAESWRRMMLSLDDHFGSDASLDQETTAAITAFLVANARTARRDASATATSAPLRITEMAWFTHEHDEISPGKWQSVAVGSAANCGACHRNAAQGRFSEHEIKVP
jgi:hypothetical protein